MYNTQCITHAAVFQAISPAVFPLKQLSQEHFMDSYSGIMSHQENISGMTSISMSSLVGWIDENMM